jgi:hypothetical protein
MCIAWNCRFLVKLFLLIFKYCLFPHGHALQCYLHVHSTCLRALTPSQTWLWEGTHVGIKLLSPKDICLKHHTNRCAAFQNNKQMSFGDNSFIPTCVPSQSQVCEGVRALPVPRSDEERIFAWGNHFSQDPHAILFMFRWNFCPTLIL